MATSEQPDRLEHEDRWARAKIGPTVTVAYTGTAARTAAALEVGFYRLAATTDCHILQGAISSVAATTGDYPLYIGQEAYMQVDSWTDSNTILTTPYDAQDQSVSAIRMTTSGTLFVSLISRLNASRP